MHGMCLVVSDLTDSIRVIGEEMDINDFYEYDSKLVELSWADVTTDIEAAPDNSLPRQYYLFQNRPNPFNPGTHIEFNLPGKSQVTLSIYNLLGQQVNTLIEDELPAGIHSIYWDGTDYSGDTVSSGIYLYRLQAGDIIETKKMLYLK
jgi:hypothetical protein